MREGVKKAIDGRQIPRGEAPLVSFIVPVFNTRDFVIETLDSIAALGMSNIELIIVDDGSTDDSSTIISRWVSSRAVQVLLLKQENRGLSEARMTGMAYAEGEYIAFCDSDDWINVSTYMHLAYLAKSYGCDLALCRSAVFDSLTQDAYDFYDSWLWDQILKDRRSIITNIKRDPRLFRLEPNANPRLLKRSFAIDSKITFPSGLQFEDLPVHVEELVLAGKVLLLNRTGYFYRVNRAGKITDQRSEGRFDILKAANIAFEAARRHRLSIAGQGYILASASRMIYWCGKNTLNKDRSRFYSEACNMIIEKVDPATIKYCIDHCTVERESVLVAALATKSVKFLEAYAAGSRIPLFGYLRLIMNKANGKVLRAVTKRIIFQKVKLAVFLYRKRSW
jgi:glycosyltransferase involved in cell wall biosynthesis